MKTKIIQNIKSIILAILLVIGASYVYAQSGVWTNPECGPTGCNTPTPLNVSNTGQQKLGGLTLNLGTSGGSAPYGLIVANGNVGIGVINPTLTLMMKAPSTASTYLGVDAATSRDSAIILLNNGLQKWQINNQGASGNDLRIHNYTTGVTAMQIFGANNNVYFGNQVRIAGGSPDVGKVLTATDNFGNATWQTPSAGSGGVRVFSSVYTEKRHLTNTSGSWTDTGLAIVVTPSSSSSKLLINANIAATNGSWGYNCDVGLFEDNTALIAPFASLGLTDHDSIQSSVTYVDTADNTSARTYKVKIRGSSGIYGTVNGVHCFINQSDNLIFSGASTISVIEIP